MAEMLPSSDSAHYSSRPGSGTKTGRVWDIADEISRQRGRRATLLEVKKKFVDEEGGEGTTCSTTYYQWRASYETHAGEDGMAEDAVEFGVASDISGDPAAPLQIDPGVRLTIGDNGRIVVPKEMRDAMALSEDGAVTARLVDGELRLISPRAAIARAQRRLAHLKRPGVSVVDEFLAERRAMWGEE